MSVRVEQIIEYKVKEGALVDLGDIGVGAMPEWAESCTILKADALILEPQSAAFTFENTGDITIENASLEGYDVGVKTKETGDIKMKNIRSSVKR